MTRRGRVLLWSAGVLAVLVLGAAGAGAWIYGELDGNIHAADVDNRIGGERPRNMSPGSKNILVVGSDSRAGGNAAYGKGLETMQSDTLMVLHLAADREWATAVSLPRDSWVRIPACDRGDGTRSEPHSFKINASFAIGGTGGDVGAAAACTIRTVEQNTGLRIDHFVSVDFQGFKGMVNALGGIEVCPEAAIRDEKARLDLEAGCQTVRDEDALGYVRTRYSVGDGSDIGRIGRQQEFMKALAAKARQTLTSPADLYGFLDSATRSITTDRALAGIKPLSALAAELKGIPADRLTFLTVPNYAREADVPSDRANVVWQYPRPPISSTRWPRTASPTGRRWRPRPPTRSTPARSGSGCSTGPASPAGPRRPPRSCATSATPSSVRGTPRIRPNVRPYCTRRAWRTTHGCSPPGWTGSRPTRTSRVRARSSPWSSGRTTRAPPEASPVPVRAARPPPRTGIGTTTTAPPYRHRAGRPPAVVEFLNPCPMSSARHTLPLAGRTFRAGATW